MRSPNILLIILDTLRRDRLSLYGSPRRTSPYLDEFATRAHVFRRAVAPAHWTIPSHASMFTGEYPSAHGMTQGDHLLTGTLPTLAELLAASDYHTVGFCNNPLVGVLLNGLQRGFREFYNYAGAVPNRPPSGDGGVGGRFRTWFYPHARRIAHTFSQSDWLFRVSLNPVLTPIWTRYVNFKGSTLNSLDDAERYWTAYHGDQPLFMFVNLMGTHLPYYPPADLLDQIAPGRRQDRHAYAFVNTLNRDSTAWASPRETPLADWQQQTLLDFYDAEIAAQDRALSRLLAALDASGRETLVVIAADHGECHGEHDLFGHTFDVHQELVHVPLIIRHPDFPNGGEIGANVSTRRIFHTLLDAANVRHKNADRSLLPLLEGGHDPEDGIAFSEAFAPSLFLRVMEHRDSPLIERMHLRSTRRAVYQGDYKLILRDDVGTTSVEALYNVAEDAAETRDLAGEQPDRVANLRGQIEGFMRRADQPDVNSIAVDETVVEHLRALGYIE